MVRTTQYHANESRRPGSALRSVGRAAVLCVTCALLLATAGCGGGTQGTSAAGSSETTKVAGAHMAGPAAEVHVSRDAIAAAPKPPQLTTAESAVRSYIDWTSYAYRIGQSKFASATVSSSEEVRVDSYCQLNIQKGRLMDGKLTSITFGSPSVGSTSTLVPTKEDWTYSYLSTQKGNKSLGGPYTASYDSTYTVIKNKMGNWVVDSLQATAKGTVK